MHLGLAPVIEPIAQLPPRVLVFGASTGGPDALAQLMPMLPALPVLVAQHVPPSATEPLRAHLSAYTERRVIVPDSPLVPACDRVLVAPGGAALALEQSVLGPVAHQLPRAPQQSIDLLFDSAARTYGPAVLAVVLSGRGQDGLRGAIAVHEAGGQVLVQHPDCCVAPSMPRAVLEAGVASAALSLTEISVELQLRPAAAQVFDPTPD